MPNRPLDFELPAGVPLEVHRAFAALELLHEATEVESAVDQLAIRLTVALQDRNPIFLAALNGGLMLAGMLQRRMVFAAQFGYVGVGRYGDRTTGGELKWHGYDAPDMQQRTVVFIDDILDQGQTLLELISWAKEGGASEVLTVALIERTDAHRTNLPSADFSAFKAGPGFLVGCGMDIAGYGRNLPGIYVLPEQ